MRNAEEIAYWNAGAGSRWASWQARIDVAFAGITAAALAAAAPAPGAAVLDVGCGCGTTSLALGAAVTGAGRVLGVDISVPMLALAETRARQAGVTNVAFVRSDAATHAFEPASFHLAFSRFGVMFFDDPAAAFANIRSALRPGARLAFACWRGLAENPMFSVPRDAVLPLVPPPEPADPLAPGPMAFADPERVRGILTEAGFHDVCIDPFEAAMPFGALADAAAFFTNIGPAARLLEGVDERTLAAGGEALDAALRQHETDGTVTFAGRVWIVRASN